MLAATGCQAVINSLMSRANDRDAAGEVAHHTPKVFSVYEAGMVLIGFGNERVHVSS